MAEKITSEDPVITVKLRRGLADRNRLPLAHFLNVLDEFRQMMISVGKRIQRDRGAMFPTGDFGLEIIAGEEGNAVKPGSVWSPLAITNNAEVGVLAAEEVIRTLRRLEHDAGILEPNLEIDRDLIRRLSRVARIQRVDRTELEISIQRPGYPDPLTASFGSAGLSSIRALQSPTFEVEGMSLYGKLVELLDRDPSEEDGKGFWGELRRDNGEPWRIQFKPSQVDEVTKLFRKQVVVIGKAVYYRVATHKLVAESIAADTERDYEAAFEELHGCYKSAFSPELLKALRGEE
ncbi:MAG: hypothetical protein WBW33_12935 [Bryobacteraceae bacterium]